MECSARSRDAKLSWRKVMDPDLQMEGMVTDLQLARDKQQQFEEWRTNQGKSLKIDLIVTVLTTGFWPSYKVNSACSPSAPAPASHFPCCCVCCLVVSPLHLQCHTLHDACTCSAAVAVAVQCSRFIQVQISAIPSRSQLTAVHEIAASGSCALATCCGLRSTSVT